MPSPVIVNLNVNVDATGNIEVFGSAPDDQANVVVASQTLPVNALYDSTKNGTMGAGLIEFWEPSADLGNIYAKLADGSDFNINGAASYKQTAKVLASGLQRLLVDSLDASAASPFNKYGGNANYTTCSDFGRLALSTYAHYLFGHVDATAAITNDEAFMSSMLSLYSTDYVKDAQKDNPSGRYGDWSKKSDVNSIDVDSWSSTQTSSDANLAIALVKAILAKATSAPLSATRSTPAATAAGAVYGSDTLANIVKQVIGQDASRAMGQDNNQLTPDVHQILRFEPGDTIYVSITLNTPVVTILNGNTNQGAPADTKYDKDVSAAGIQKEKYDIKITLGPRSTEYDVAPAPASFYTGSELPFTITEIAYLQGRLIISSNGLYTGDTNIQVIKNSDFSVERGVNSFQGQSINDSGSFTAVAAVFDKTLVPGDTLQLYRLYDQDNVTKLATPVALSNVFTIPTPDSEPLPDVTSYPISITSVDTVNRQINWTVQSDPSGIYEFQYSTDGTTWNLACASGMPRVQVSLFTELNDIPVDTSFMMTSGATYTTPINANYFTGLVDNVAQYVSVPSVLSGVYFRAVLSNPDTWYNTGALNKPTPLSPIEVVSAEFIAD